MKTIIKTFDELTTLELYQIYKLRTDVFVVEQDCAYPEVDELDLCSHHMWYEEDGQILAYLRVVPPGAHFAEASLGRIIAAKRGTGLGRQLVSDGIALEQQLYPATPIRIAAQVQASGFYRKLGFLQVSEPFDDAGVMHIEMVWGEDGVK